MRYNARCTRKSTVQLPVSKTLNAPTGARNTVQAEGAVRCTMRCDAQCTMKSTVQLPVSETLNAPTGARNTVHAIGAVRCRQRDPPVCLSKTGDKVKYLPVESAAISSDVASPREAGGRVHTYTTLRLRLVWCYARLQRGTASPRLCYCYCFVAVYVWWVLAKVRSWMMPVAVSETLDAPTGALNTVQAEGAVR